MIHRDLITRRSKFKIFTGIEFRWFFSYFACEIKSQRNPIPAKINLFKINIYDYLEIRSQEVIKESKDLSISKYGWPNNCCMGLFWRIIPFICIEILPKKWFPIYFLTYCPVLVPAVQFVGSGKPAHQCTNFSIGADSWLFFLILRRLIKIFEKLLKFPVNGSFRVKMIR